MIPLATYTGRIVDVEDLRMEDIDIEDIAQSHSNDCRFGGQTRAFYSVAQHAVYASYLVSPEHALDALLHDGPEAYLRDLPAPIKRRMPTYKVLERRVWERIARRFDLLPDLPAEVHEADVRLCATEARDLFPQTAAIQAAYFGGGEPYAGTVHPVHPTTARDIFLARFAELTGGARDPSVPYLRLAPVAEERV